MMSLFRSCMACYSTGWAVSWPMPSMLAFEALKKLGTGGVRDVTAKDRAVDLQPSLFFKLLL